MLDKSEVIVLDKFIVMYNKTTLDTVDIIINKKKTIIVKYLNCSKFIFKAIYNRSTIWISKSMSGKIKIVITGIIAPMVKISNNDENIVKNIKYG